MMLKVTLYSEDCNLIKVVIAPGIHLFPSRTEKLSPVTPMVLRKWESRQPPLKSPRQQTLPRRCFLYTCHISSTHLYALLTRHLSASLTKVESSAAGMCAMFLYATMACLCV